MPINVQQTNSAYFFRFLLILATLISTTFCYGQRVGLVLSGGGSRGVAHIGVLKAFEEHHIPIDYIAGTSMGAIIGGFYASGFTIDSIQAIVTSDDFQKWASGNLDRDYSLYYRMPPPSPSWADLDFSYDSVLTADLPTNLVSPLQMDYTLREFFSAPTAVSGGNFDSLFIPFRTVATDIANNQPYSLSKGDLGNAIRASMTFPFYFKPIRINGILLFDGGMTNNFPSDIMYEDFFPDIIIGSKVVENYDPPSENNILSQLQSMVTGNTDYTVICENGIIISPDLPVVGLIDFSKAEKLIERGYLAALEHIQEIRQFVIDSISPEERQAKRDSFNRRKPELLINIIHIEGLNRYQTKFVLDKLKAGQKEIHYSNLRNTLFQLISEDHINYIFPHLIYDSLSGRFDLIIEAKASKNFSASFGGNISSRPINEAFFGFQYRIFSSRITTLSASTHIGRFYSSLFLRANTDFPLALPIFLQASLLLSQYDYFKTTTYFFEDKTPSYLIQNEHIIDVSAGIPTGNKSKLTGSINIARLGNNYFQTNFFGRIDVPDKTNFNFISYGLSWEKNTLNRKQYSNKGEFYFAEIISIAGRERYIPGSTSPQPGSTRKNHSWWRLQAIYENHLYQRDNYVAALHIHGNFSNQALFSNHTATSIIATSFQPIPESKTIYIPEFSALNFIGLGLRNIYKIRRNLDFRIEGHIFQPYQKLISGDENKTEFGRVLAHRHFLISGVLVYHTILGPAGISMNYYDNPDRKVYFAFNFGYMIYNRRPL